MTKSFNFNLQAKITLLTIVSAACTGSSIISPCLPILGKYLNIDKNQISILMSLYLFGYLSGQFFYSVISHKFGYNTALKTGFTIYILSSILQLISININLIGLLYYARFFCAFGASSGLICTFAIINQFFNKKESKKYIALSFISLTLFSYLSITFGGFITQLYGFKCIFYVLIFISIIQFIMIYKFLPNLYPLIKNKKDNFNKYLKGYIESFLNKKLMLTSIIVAFTTTTTYLYNSIAPIISYDIFRLQPHYFGLFSTLNLLGLILGGYASSILSKRYISKYILLVGIIICSIPILLFSTLNNFIFNIKSTGFIFFLLNAILNFGLGLIYPSASYLSLNSIKCNSTSSSIMNIIKIGCPAIVLFIISQLKISLINSFIIPLDIFFIIVLFSSVGLFYIDQQDTRDFIIA